MELLSNPKKQHMNQREEACWETSRHANRNTKDTKQPEHNLEDSSKMGRSPQSLKSISAGMLRDAHGADRKRHEWATYHYSDICSKKMASGKEAVMGAIAPEATHIEDPN